MVEPMSVTPLLGFTDGDRWRPGIGDPNFIGWFTVFAYAVAAVLCFREARRDQEIRRRFVFWSILGTLMVLLGINKQLDLQTWLTLTGRHLARDEGWYGSRRVMQLWFILGIALAGFLGFGVVWRWVREEGEDLWLPLFGLFTLICFVIIRAASFHHIDEFLHTRLAGFKLNWLLELGGITLIIVGALRTEDRVAPPDQSAWLQDA